MCLAAAGIVLLVLIVANNIPWLSVTLTMAGKVISGSSFLTVYCITIELMPTILRNTGLASCSVFARIGAIIEPLITQMSLITVAAVFGCMLLINSVVVLLLPETRGAVLADTLEESEQFGKHEKMLTLFKEPKTRTVFPDTNEAADVNLNDKEALKDSSLSDHEDA